MTIGDKIRNYRKKLGLTQEDIASRLQTTPQTIYKYEKGLVENIPLNNITALARIFGISPSELTGWTDDFPDPYEIAMNRQRQQQEMINFKLSNTEKELIRKYRAKPEYRDAVHRLLGVSELPDDKASSRDFDSLPPFSENFNTPLSKLRAASPPLPRYKLHKDDEKK